MVRYPVILDRISHALLAKLTGGISPAGIWLAFADWSVHLALSPGKQLDLCIKLTDYAAEWQRYMACMLAGNGTERCVTPAAGDRRFENELWLNWPFNVIHQGFLLHEKLWDDASRDVRGVAQAHENVVNFCIRQALDTLSPSNFVLTNPEVLECTLREGGANFLRGLGNLAEDLGRTATGRPPHGIEAFRVGENIAATKGKVIYRNDLIELIQYSPATEAVYSEPLLIIPAWIMKYYILDLSPHNSLVKYLVDHGFTVFMISWKNPGERYRHFGMEDYRRLGIMAALEVVSKVVPNRYVHAAGYCLGGTLLAIAASAMARDHNDALKTLTLFAAQTDFSQPGELDLFISESQLAFLEDMMEEYGYLDGSQMAATFQLLRSNDLIWSRMLREYLMGTRQTMTDLMAWNADATRLPAKMHSEYLRHIYLENQLAEGRYLVEDRPVALRDIRVPIFVVGTERDHIAPWRSVYQINLLTDTEVTFVLTSGGHNAGIVSEPGHKNRTYRIATAKHGDPYIDAETWFKQNPQRAGSWWPAWLEWLKRCSGELGKPPSMGAPDAGYAPLCDAPGTYVFE